MLPVIDKPTIQYVMEEAVAAGLHDVLLITGRGKQAIEDHFDRALELEQTLQAKGDETKLAQITQSEKLATVHYTRQHTPRGLGHAVLCGAEHVGNEPFAVLLGDDFIHPDDALLQRMLDVRAARGGTVIALMEVPAEQVSQYGAVAMEPTDEGDVVTVSDMVEKPPPGEAPSNWIVIGRYVCDPAVFEVLRRTPPGRGNEIQLTDALKTLAQMPASEGGGVYGVQFRGRRYDTGNPLDFLRTTMQFACDRPEIASEFLPWLRKYLDELG
jgi:UTP--glucose-1-phosphate uridylyltransferase